MTVKICGITRLEDALLAAGEGAAAVGFIFAPSSPRYIDPESAGCIIRSLPPFVTPVGVFVNEPRESILRTIAVAGVRCLQLHGDETPADTEGYHLPVIKSFRVQQGFNPGVLAGYLTTAHLLDAYAPGAYGGTGQTFDWEIALHAGRYGSIILSGGITPENVVSAIRMARPYAIDVSSGVESSPGVKDPDKIRRLFQNIRSGGI
jgi:phosphoribosylanthranilate isomerase